MAVVDFSDLECEASQNQLLFAQGVDINMMVEEKPDGMRRNS